MDAHGDSDLLIWVTEYGQPSTQVSEANQAAYIADFLAAWSELTGVGPAFLYSLIDTATGSATAEDNLGLFTDDWTAKAVVEVIKAWIAGQPVTVDPGESSSGNSVVELLSALARAAQSFITAITEMVLTPFNGIAQFVQGVVDAVVNLISTVSGAKTSATTTTLTDTTASAASVTADGVDTVEKATATRMTPRCWLPSSSNRTTLVSMPPTSSPPWPPKTWMTQSSPWPPQTCRPPTSSSTYRPP